MTIQEIQRMQTTRPFQPFRIRTADGQKYDVQHPGNMAYSGKGRTVVVAMPDDSFTHVDLLLVTAIERPISRRQSGSRR